MTSPFDETTNTELEDERGKSRAQIDLDDLSRELAGASNKTQRFTAESAGHGREGEKKRKQQEFERILDELTRRRLDADYERAFQAASAAISQAQDALDAALEENARHIEELEANAARLADGRMVFLRKDGKGETADGEIIPLEVMVTLDIPDNATTIEDYNAARARRRELGGYGDEVDAARNEINDPENPADKDRLDDVEKRMKTLTKEINGSYNLTASFNAVSSPEAAPNTQELDFSEIAFPPPA